MQLKTSMPAGRRLERDNAPMDNGLNTLQAMGLTLPSPAYLIISFLFGLIGIAAYRYGKRAERPRSKWIGVALMVYPYAISATWLMVAVGLALCAGLWIDRRF